MKQKKFMTIYDDLRVQITEGTLAHGMKMPSEYQLVSDYGASRETVRKALDLLVANGMIQKVRGKGSIVIYQGMTEFPFDQLVSFKEMKATLGLAHETRVVHFDCIEAREVQDVQQALDVQPSTLLWHVVRHRIVEGRVKIVDEDYFVCDMVPQLTSDIAAQSIYDYIEGELGCEISFSNKAITFEPFRKEDIEAFGTIDPPYTATVRGIVHFKDTRKFQYNVSKHIATEFKFVDFSRRRQG